MPRRGRRRHRRARPTRRPAGCTLRHLLSHAGGYGFDGPEPIAKPERNRIYSNTGIEMAAQTVADAAAIRFGDYLSEAVLHPLGMTSTDADRVRRRTGCGARPPISPVSSHEVRSPTLISPASAAEATTVQFPALNGIIPGHRPLLAVPVGTRLRDPRHEATALDRHNELAADVWTFRRGRYLSVGGSCRGGGQPRPDRSSFRRVGRRALASLARVQRRRAGRGLGMMYRPGDRVRFETTGDDGWPLIRYGFVGGVSGNGGPVVVMLDGELSGDVVNRSRAATGHHHQRRAVPARRRPDRRSRATSRPRRAVARRSRFRRPRCRRVASDRRRPPRVRRLLGTGRTDDRRSALRRARRCSYRTSPKSSGCAPRAATATSQTFGGRGTVSSGARRSWPCPGRRRRTCSPGRRSCPRTAAR